MTPANLFFFGYGYVAQRLDHLLPSVTKTAGCTRKPLQQESLFPFANIPYPILDQFDNFLISIPPDAEGDITLRHYSSYFKNRAKPIKWIGYLSATSVYGDHHGNWIDENTPAMPCSPRGHYRLTAEQHWQQLGFPLSILRLSGIYGPGRSAIESILNNKAQLIEKPGHVFNRIHVDDICRVILASTTIQPKLANLADDCPAALVEVYLYAYKLLSLPPAPVHIWESVPLSAMMQDFFSENKRIKNTLIKKILKDDLLYPSYREGLGDCLKWHQKGRARST
ncbi:SDR family oxidoreductase [Candidatus Odyssella thessalonicensis]|uniref:SDR family oxidoreductase n=1 Tax=Candidatus Odyssella thessalonicensis TaxID=84647 RepID=UPI000225BDBD|nr:SDR family oxidoreductase [Candidatus Odyssella thessalonicensis]